MGDNQKIETIEWRKGNHLDELLSILAVSGEMGYRSLDVLGGREIYRQTLYKGKKMVRVRNAYTGEEVVAKLFNVTGTGELKTICLSRKAGEVLAWKDKSRPYEDNYLKVLSGDKKKIERRHRVAETLAMFEKMNIPYWKNQLVPFQGERGNAKPLRAPMFYSSLDLKLHFALCDEDRAGLNKSRMVGCLMSEAGAYVVYNVKNGVRKWKPKGEADMRGVCEMYEANTFDTFHTKYLKHDDKCSCILISDNYNSGLATLLSKQLNIDENTTEAEIAEKFKRKNYNETEFGKMFTGCHCVTLDSNGRDILRILTTVKHRPTILQTLFRDKWIGINEQTGFIYDAETLDGGRAITLVNGDIGRFNKFATHVNNNPTARKYHVYCYPEQVNFVIERTGTLAKIHVLDIQKIFDILGLGEAESAYDEEYIKEWQEYADWKTEQQ